MSEPTYDGYERQDWVDFREKVLDICPVCDPDGVTRLLTEWGLTRFTPDMTAAAIAEDMQIIIDRLDPERIDA